jgi:serine/threonine protein kinase
MVKEGVNRSAYYEIMTLRELDHEHVIKLKDVYEHQQNVHLVIELCFTDLGEILKASRWPSVGLISLSHTHTLFSLSRSCSLFPLFCAV